MNRLPKVAIVGRPNVGKSTLFNRITGKRRAIVHETPGVTRDVQSMNSEWNGVHFTIVDTGGLFSGDPDPIVKEVEDRALKEAFEADALVFVTDAHTGLTPMDKTIANTLRGSNLPVYLAVNKSEAKGTEYASGEFFKLGFENVYEISALHGQGIGDLLDDVVAMLPKRDGLLDEEELKVAVVGKPNVGKSSLVNALIGEDAAIVSERPGTTRDSIDIKIRWHGRDIILVDTAGIKRRSKTKDAISTLSSIKSMETISRANVVVLMLDATLPISNQDVRVGSYAHKEGKGIIICVNKWDLIEKDNSTARHFEDSVRESFAFMSYAPILFISALTGQRVSKVLSTVWRIKETRERRIATGELNRFLEGVIASSPPSFHGGGTGKIYYATQTDVAPPTFVLFVNKRRFFDRSYLRYLNNKIRKAYSFDGSIIRINMKEKTQKRD